MLPTTRVRIANALIVLVFVLLAVTVYGMLRTPRPAWSRGLAIPALVLAIVASGTRRRVGRAA
jgi:hypothetical protein